MGFDLITLALAKKYTDGAEIDLGEYGVANAIVNLILSGGGSATVDSLKPMWEKINANENFVIRLPFGSGTSDMKPTFVYGMLGIRNMFGCSFTTIYNGEAVAVNMVFSTSVSSSDTGTHYSESTTIVATVTQTALSQ